MNKLNFNMLCFFISCLFLFSSCEKNGMYSQVPVLSDSVKYQNAIKDAMVAEQNEICYKLIAINDSNHYLTWSGTGSEKKVLVLTWTKYPGSFHENQTVTNTWGVLWVTVVPEMKDWFRTNYPTGSDYVSRTEKLLGLPLNSGNTNFVEIWVKPADLWRPSPDNEVTDNFAQLDFPENTDSTYRAWFNNNIIYSYYPMHYPWTRLGYTYDWGSPATEIGLSEFIVKKNSLITVRKIYDNTAFFKAIFNLK